MPDQWLTVVQAAAALNVHPRTIERRIASGKLQTRRTDDAQVQVLIDAPDTAPGAPDPLETVKELAQDQVNLATGSATAIVRLAQADADRARQELDLVRQAAGRARRQARAAWSTVGTMAALVMVAIAWTSHRVTDAGNRIETMQSEVGRLRLESSSLRVQRDQAQRDADAARLAGAEANGRLAAYREQARLLSDSRPTTQPSNLIQRVATAVWGD